MQRVFVSITFSPAKSISRLVKQKEEEIIVVREGPRFPDFRDGF